jgi:hypothetical protein
MIKMGRFTRSSQGWISKASSIKRDTALTLSRKRSLVAIDYVPRWELIAGKGLVFDKA